MASALTTPFWKIFMRARMVDSIGSELLGFCAGFQPLGAADGSGLIPGIEAQVRWLLRRCQRFLPPEDRGDHRIGPRKRVPANRVDLPGVPGWSDDACSRVDTRCPAVRRSRRLPINPRRRSIPAQERNHLVEPVPPIRRPETLARAGPMEPRPGDRESARPHEPTDGFVAGWRGGDDGERLVAAGGQPRAKWRVPR